MLPFCGGGGYVHDDDHGGHGDVCDVSHGGSRGDDDDQNRDDGRLPDTVR